MLFKLPYIVEAGFQRGRRMTQEEGYVTYLADVNIPEITGDAAPVVAEVNRFGALIPVRKYGDQFYVPLIDQSAERHEILRLEHLKQENWSDYAAPLMQMLRAVVSEGGADDISMPYGHWAYQNMFTTLEGSAGVGYAAYVPEADVRWSNVSEDERVIRERTAVEAYQSCRIIDGLLYRPCTEPKYLVRFRWACVLIDISFDEIEHRKPLGLRKEEKYEPPIEMVSFRLDRYEDLLDYVDSRVGRQFERISIGNLAVVLSDFSAFQYDDEANDLDRAARWIIEEDYKHLLAASDDAAMAWVELKRKIGKIRVYGEESLGDDLAQALRDHHPFALSERSKAAIEDATNRYDMRPVVPVRNL
jgi:hypothetical protein